MAELSIIAPGLFGPLPELKDTNLDVYDCRLLTRWLACAKQTATSVNNYYDQLALLFDVEPCLSVTQLTAIADGIDISNGHWMRADPVHFKADLDHALLVDSEQLLIEEHEAQALVSHFNQHFYEDELKLHYTHSGRWYLQSGKAYDVETVDLQDAIGRNVHHFLPKGNDELNWRKVLNEAQMLFYSHDVNVQREAKGQMSINSLWLWGEGKAPAADARPKFDWMISSEVVATGLAKVFSVEQQSTEDFGKLSGDGLLVIDEALSAMAYGDVLRWNQAVESICKQWLQPVHELLRSGQLKKLYLYTAEGRKFELTKTSLLKFWRRKYPLRKYININE